MGLLGKIDLGKIKEAAEIGARAAQDSISNIDIEKVTKTVGDTVESGVKAAQDGIAKIDAREVAKFVEGGIKASKEALGSFDVAEAAQDAKSLVSSGAENASKFIGGLFKKDEEQQETNPRTDFIALLWLLALTNDSLSTEEEKRIDEIALSLDESYKSYASEMKTACTELVAENAREFGAASAAKMQAKTLIDGMEPSARDGKLLCWNLFAVANADGLDEAEIDFIRYASEAAGVDAGVFEELRNYSCTINEIEQERQALRTVDRSYGIINPIMDELSSRQQVIIEAAQALVMDK